MASTTGESWDGGDDAAAAATGKTGKHIESNTRRMSAAHGHAPPLAAGEAAGGCGTG